MPPRKAEDAGTAPERSGALAGTPAEGRSAAVVRAAPAAFGSIRADAERLLSGLRERDRGPQPVQLVRADAAVVAGLPPERAEAALQHLLREHRSHLLVTEDGDLVYQFSPGLERRDAKGLGERLGRAGRAALSALWRGFQIGFKVWIAVTLVLYTVLFALLGLALMFVSEDDGPGGLVLWLLPDFGPSRLGPADEAPRKRFHRSVFDFVFGPEAPPEQAALAAGVVDDRRLLRQVRELSGRLTATDLVLAHGWGYARAEEEATRLLAAYDGEPVVAEDGSLLYSFRDLRRTALAAPGPAPAHPLAVDALEGRRGALAPVRAWPPGAGRRVELHRPSPGLLAYERELPLTGNSGGANAGITALNAFNLVAALTLGPLCALWLSLGPLATALLTIVPLVFSAMFFALPVGRAARRRLGRAGRRRRNLRRALLDAIAARGGAPTPPAELCQAAVHAVVEAARLHGEGQDYGPFGDGRAVEELRRLAAAELERLLIELDGDVRAPGDGAGDGERVTRYEFPRLRQELAAAAEARGQAEDRERQLGPVIFSSASEGSGV